MSYCDVLLFGDYFCDLIITGLSEVPHLGADVFGEAMTITPGGAYILATALHRLEVQTRWAPRLGDDLFSRFVLEEAHKEGLDTSLFEQVGQAHRSLSVSFSFAHDRGFISYTDPDPGRDYAALIAAQRPAWVVNLPFDGSEASRRLVDRVHACGGRVFADCQYTTARLDDPGLDELLRALDVFAPNRSEAAQLTGQSDPEAAAGALARFCPLVVVKCGADGACARAGERAWHSPALRVEPVDTTGAGDCFNAGFLSAHLRGEPIETCLRYGNICGGLSVTRPGGTSAAPTLDQVQAYLEEQP